jgi:hypothetical protein
MLNESFKSKDETNALQEKDQTNVIEKRNASALNRILAIRLPNGSSYDEFVCDQY